jgi:S1-C subfamily serine protease
MKSAEYIVNITLSILMICIPAPVAQTPPTVDATTSASFKLEPYIPYHDTLKKFVYSIFAAQHQVLRGVVGQSGKAVVSLGILETFGGKTRETAIGTGLIIDPRGYVVTVADNIADNVNFKVHLFDGNHLHEFDAYLETIDPAADVALLRIRATGSFIVPFFVLSDNPPVNVGDWVIANGSSDGLHVIPMQGIVSSTNRSRKVNGRYFYNLIKTELTMTGAMMGSPVFDVHGNCIGLYTGGGFVLPVGENSSPLFSMAGIR